MCSFLYSKSLAKFEQLWIVVSQTSVNQPLQNVADVARLRKRLISFSMQRSQNPSAERHVVGLSGRPKFFEVFRFGSDRKPGSRFFRLFLSHSVSLRCSGASFKSKVTMSVHRIFFGYPLTCKIYNLCSELSHVENHFFVQGGTMKSTTFKPAEVMWDVRPSAEQTAGFFTDSASADLHRFCAGCFRFRTMVFERV